MDCGLESGKSLLIWEQGIQFSFQGISPREQGPDQEEQGAGFSIQPSASFCALQSSRMES